MVTLIRREFEVPAPLDVAWNYLAQVQRWPEWAGHIKEVRLTPDGPLTPDSVGVIHLRNGLRSKFRMARFEPKRSWLWRGKFLWLTIDYDHQFVANAKGGTTMIWLVMAKGWAAGSAGRALAAIYNRNLNKAIPRLTAKFRNLSAKDHADTLFDQRIDSGTRA
jgi:hypothetical protein